MVKRMFFLAGVGALFFMLCFSVFAETPRFGLRTTDNGGGIAMDLAPGSHYRTGLFLINYDLERFSDLQLYFSESSPAEDGSYLSLPAEWVKFDEASVVVSPYKMATKYVYFVVPEDVEQGSYRGLFTVKLVDYDGSPAVSGGVVFSTAIGLSVKLNVGDEFDLVDDFDPADIVFVSEDLGSDVVLEDEDVLSEVEEFLTGYRGVFYVLLFIVGFVLILGLFYVNGRKRKSVKRKK